MIRGRNDGYLQCKFLVLHRTSNGPWTKWSLSERTMSKGPPRKVHLAPMGRYNYPIHSKLENSGRAPLRWAAKL
jgi:hypothetical protein